MPRYASDFTTCGTALRLFWCARRPIRRPHRHCYGIRDVKTTLQLYAHSISEDRMAAQGQVLEAILQSGRKAVNWGKLPESWAEPGLKAFRSFDVSPLKCGGQGRS